MLKSLSTLVVALVVLALIGGAASAQCQAACAPAVQLAPQYVPQVQQTTYAAPVVAVPLYVVPSAPTVQLNVQPQYAAPVVVQQAPVVVQKQVIQKTVVQQVPVVQKQVIQKQVIQKQAAPQRQRSFSLQRTVIR